MEKKKKSKEKKAKTQTCSYRKSRFQVECIVKKKKKSFIFLLNQKLLYVKSKFTDLYKTDTKKSHQDLSVDAASYRS